MSVDINNLGAGSVRDRQSAELRESSRKAAETADNGDNHTATARATDVELSDDALSLARLAGSESSASFDSDRVESIRQAISEGRYHIDPERLAEKIIDLEIELNQ